MQTIKINEYVLIFLTFPKGAKENMEKPMIVAILLPLNFKVRAY
jgi:uncharacterized protein (DUF302 family)